MATIHQDLDQPDYVTAPIAIAVIDADCDQAARSAIAAAGLRTAASVSLTDAVDRLDLQARLDVVLVDVSAVDLDDAARSAALGRVAAQASLREAGLVIVLRSAQIDPVAAATLEHAATLLCDPEPAEVAAALSVAALPRATALNETTRDSDDRMRRLNMEIARFAETVARLSTDRPASERLAVQAARTSFSAEPAPLVRAAISAGEVRDVIRARRMRAGHFPSELFADPAWDMLLDLFAAWLEHRRVSVSSLCIAAAVPGTTALRWIGTMVDAGLFLRQADPDDGRRAFVSLTDTAIEGMQRYFDAARRAGLSPA
jgi:hypothetical protein